MKSILLEAQNPRPRGGSWPIGVRVIPREGRVVREAPKETIIHCPFPLNWESLRRWANRHGYPLPRVNHLKWGATMDWFLVETQDGQVLQFPFRWRKGGIEE